MAARRSVEDTFDYQSPRLFPRWKTLDLLEQELNLAMYLNQQIALMDNIDFNEFLYFHRKVVEMVSIKQQAGNTPNNMFSISR